MTESGPVGQAIADMAEPHRVDLVVTGSRGRSRLGGLVPGSTAYQLIHLVRCPVLVVRYALRRSPASGWSRCRPWTSSSDRSAPER